MATINSINMNQAPFVVNHADGTARPVVRQPGAGNMLTIPATPNEPLLQPKERSSHVALGQRQTINSSLNEAAVSVRTADRTMKTIGSRISSMRSQLDAIVKHYPPFLTTDPNRIRALRSFSAFRKEIEALTIPPGDIGAAKIMADPAVFPQAGSQSIALGNGGTGAIQGRQVHTGPTGLNIPALTDGATDAEIHSAISSLDAAQATLGQRQAGLSMDWAMIVPTGKYTDATAEQASAELGKTIAQGTWQGFAGSRQLLSQLA